MKDGKNLYCPKGRRGRADRGSDLGSPLIYNFANINILGGFERVSDASHREFIPPASLGGI
jgi:hypothetical protein